MKKSDLSIKNICIAAIKRNTIPPFDFKFSKLYTEDTSFADPKILEALKLAADELVICSVIINTTQWSVLTTRRVITWDREELFAYAISDFEERELEDFKDDFYAKWTKNIFKFSNNEKMPVFIETGRASMVMIYGTQTAFQIF